MTNRLALASLVGAGLALAAALASGPACTAGADAADAGASAGGGYEDAPTFCDLFTEAGAPCPAASATACFPMCATGGCFCRATPVGPRWTCTVDFSCVPEAGPLEDAGASTDDAGTTEPFDAGDATTTDAGAADAASDVDLSTSDGGDAAALDAADASDAGD